MRCPKHFPMLVTIIALGRGKSGARPFAGRGGEESWGFLVQGATRQCLFNQVFLPSNAGKSNICKKSKPLWIWDKDQKISVAGRYFPIHKGDKDTAGLDFN